MTQQPEASPASSGVGEIECEDRDSFGWIASPVAIVNWQRVASTPTPWYPRLSFRTFWLSPFTIFTIFDEFRENRENREGWRYNFDYSAKLSGSVNTRPTRAPATSDDPGYSIDSFPQLFTVFALHRIGESRFSWFHDFHEFHEFHEFQTKIVKIVKTREPHGQTLRQSNSNSFTVFSFQWPRALLDGQCITGRSFYFGRRVDSPRATLRFSRF